MEIYHGATFQRVYQYLSQDKARKNLDRFTYRDGSVEGTIQDFLELILRYQCSIEQSFHSDLIKLISQACNIRVHYAVDMVSIICSRVCLYISTHGLFANNNTSFCNLAKDTIHP